MGNYRQHITFAWLLGACYSVVASLMMGVHWFYGTVATLLTTLSGLLPDLDSSSGVELKGFTGILGVLAALAVWEAVGHLDPTPIFEFHLWSMVLAYLLVRLGLRRVLSRMAKHRGISHSLPTCAVWGLATYLCYPSKFHGLRVLMAAAVMVGFFSHLLLDEICSVDLKGARVNKAFGTAIKLWAHSTWSTLAMYALMSYLAWLTIQRWPEDPYAFDLPPVDVPIQAYAISLWKKLRAAGGR
jgi:hypothetical protein